MSTYLPRLNLILRKAGPKFFVLLAQLLLKLRKLLQKLRSQILRKEKIFQTKSCPFGDQKCYKT